MNSIANIVMHYSENEQRERLQLSCSLKAYKIDNGMAMENAA